MDFLHRQLIGQKIHSFFHEGNARSLAVKKNIAASFFLKCISILISLQVVPMTIGYVNPTRYGIWLTLSSIIAWLSYFDLGFAHGFRNRFAEARSNGNTKLAKEYVSTTYAILFLLFAAVFVISLVINRFIDWSRILNIDAMYNEELHKVFGLLSCFFCINVVAQVFTTLLTADQKPALASLTTTLGQLFALICIYILTKTTVGSLTSLAIAFAGIPCLLLILVSVAVFRWSDYREIAPSFRSVRFTLSKSIIGLGGQFFVIMMSMLFIYQSINIILSRIEGPYAVTQYNIAYKYFSVLYMVAVIVLTPFWSATTDAYVRKDYDWMRRMVGKLERLWLLSMPILMVMFLCSGIAYEWWIGDSVKIPVSLSVSMAVFTWAQLGGNVYMYLINGTSKVRMQMIIYSTFAVVAIPLMIYGCRYYGIGGVLLVPTFTCFIQAIFGKIQFTKIINGTAKGIWMK